MDYLALRNQLRKIIVEASGINPETDLKTSGMVFDNTGKSIWVEEYIVGGENIAMSNRRSQTPAFLVQYDFNIPAGANTDELERIVANVEASAAPGRTLQVDNADCHIRKSKTTRDYGKNLNTVSMLFTISAVSR
jgi:hypothetical protein